MKGCLFRDRKGREKVVFGVGCSQGGGEGGGAKGGQLLQQKAQAWTQKSTPGQQLQRTLVPSSISSARRDSAFVSDVGVFFLSCCPAVLLLCGLSPCQQAPTKNDDEGFCPSPRGSSVGWIRPISRWRKAEDITSYLSRLQRRQSSPRGRACVVYLLVKSPPSLPPESRFSWEPCGLLVHWAVNVPCVTGPLTKMSEMGLRGVRRSLLGELAS